MMGIVALARAHTQTQTCPPLCPVQPDRPAPTSPWGALGCQGCMGGWWVSWQKTRSCMRVTVLCGWEPRARAGVRCWYAIWRL